MKQANHQETSHYESSTLPYVCWYQNDFLGGVRGMRAHEIGIYTILLNEMYARGRPLELSVERLARLCGCDKRTFVNVLDMLIEEGKILNLPHGLWNKRCESIFQERAKLLAQKSFAGRSSAKKRKQINAEFERLLNESARDDEQSSKSQKGEEKETPHGVSEKKLFLIESKEGKERTTEAEKSCFPPTLCQASPPTSSEHPLTSSPPSSCQEANDTTDFSEEKDTFPSSDETAQNPASCCPHTKNACSSVPASTLTTNTSHAVSKTQSRATSAKERTSTGAITKGHRLPADWQADIDAAISEGLSEEQARWQEKKFRDYWQAKSGKEALKVDWQATWRNWFRREIERIKEHQERLAIFSQHSPSQQHNSDNDALYRSLINYQTP
ncbi:YdaU family protein [Bartonella machadoae]|uniref:YdaU family protein n=1 Tax=Bartonella machadoae TaxID=2893471 RepID=UPI001F4CE55C|nr:DUF1376 domain-containing protein [Bartonella machadoae]UNE53920.1 YdaU family protein [Bartonella machadoae]